MFKLSLRKKLLLFSVVLALIPLGVSGNRMITITQDELKSSANETLLNTADQIATEINDTYLNTWRAPLMLIREAIDNENLGVEEKLSMLKGIQTLPEVVSLQITVAGAKPIMVVQNEFADQLASSGMDATEALKIPEERITELLNYAEEFVGNEVYIEDIDTWLLTMILPLQNEIAGRKGTLTARVSLNALKSSILRHPFATKGTITIIDGYGRSMFEQGTPDRTDYEVTAKARDMLRSEGRAASVFPYVRPDGANILGAFAFPAYLDWGIVAELSEEKAYAAISVMLRSLVIILVGGLGVAVIGAVFFSGRMSRPIVSIGRVAQEVGKGNFNITVPAINTGDEISELGLRMNEMIIGLKERFELTKFVSGQTISAIKRSDQDGIKLGGERRTATVFFSDIRGFTSFSEGVEPEVVIKMLNTYLSEQAKVVLKHHGDIDKFVGDELVAVFQGQHMAVNAIMCAIEIQDINERLNAKHAAENWNIAIGIGLNTGDMIMGAMGSADRMDYTILGDTVNLGARLCSNAGPGQIIISDNTYQYVKDVGFFIIEELEPIKVKGKQQPIKIYGVSVPPRPWPPNAIRNVAARPDETQDV